MNILSLNGRITEKDSKTNIVHAFTVSENAKRLIIRFSYYPKNVEDATHSRELIENGLKQYGLKCENFDYCLPIQNLVTLSFDENGKYRGACHRHPNEQIIVISDKNSTPGIINKPLESGEWQAVLNVHFAGCDIDYIIEIEEEANELFIL